jgi:hypothetical protein
MPLQTQHNYLNENIHFHMLVGMCSNWHFHILLVGMAVIQFGQSFANFLFK